MPRTFAIIPAAGHSTRMGTPKLLLPLQGRPLILHTIEAWRRSRIDQVVVVVRPGDTGLAEVVCSANAVLVVPESPPPDMKASIRAALVRIERDLAPQAQDAFLVAPADMPRLSPLVIDRLMDQHFSSDQASILVPTIAGRCGHPVLFPWPCADDVHRLPADAGLNTLVEQSTPRLIPCEDLISTGEYPFADIDTPEDFRRVTGAEEP